MYTKATATRKQSHQQHNHKLHQSDQQKQQNILRQNQPMPVWYQQSKHPQTYNTGILIRLDETNKQAAERTIQRLHRNLGHPANKELTRLLKSRNASKKLLKAAANHHCDLYYLHKPPPQLSKSTLRHGTTFNDRILANTLWISTSSHNKQDTKQDKTIPILAIMDTNTKLMIARVLDSERLQII